MIHMEIALENEFARPKDRVVSLVEALHCKEVCETTPGSNRPSLQLLFWPRSLRRAR